jgi:hypothetical protein
MKKCTKCNIEKSLSEFYFEKKRNIYHPKCKECHILYRNANKEKQHIFQKEYYNLNKNKHKERCKEWMKNNKQYAKEYRAQYYQSNRDILLEKSKEYQTNNKDKHSLYIKNRYQTDINFKLRKKLTTTLWNNLNKQNTSKLVSIRELIGCTIEEYKLYIEQQFKPEMNWDNHGKVWEIDHIKPCDSFNLTDTEQQKQCFHYSNTQPLFKTTSIAESFGYNEIGNRDKSNII